MSFMPLPKFYSILLRFKFEIIFSVPDIATIETKKANTQLLDKT